MAFRLSIVKVTIVLFLAAMTLLLVAGLYGSRKAQARRDWAAANSDSTRGAANRTLVIEAQRCDAAAVGAVLSASHAKLHELGFARVECTNGAAGTAVP